MKVKLKLDLASIKGWLLEHGEKLAFAIVGLVFLLFAYSAVRREVLDASKQPQNLSQLADRVRAHVSGSKWDQAREKVEVVDYAERAKSQPVNVVNYTLPTLLDPPVAPPKAKRDVPNVLPAEELRVAAGFDLFQFKADGAAAGGQGGQGQIGKQQAQPWAVVTALVPIEAQQAEYNRAFAQAVGGDPKTDVPVYYAPVLQRMEVKAAQGDKDDWQDVDYAKPYEDKWSGPAAEIVPAKYAHPDLTGHLGPLVNGAWGEAVSHPKIPLVSDDNPAAAAAPAAVVPEPAPAADAVNDRFRRNAKDANVPPPPTPVSGQPQEQTIKYVLLRVFDYTVVPRKKYRYRVILALMNPNHEKAPQHLKKPESAAQKNLEGQPSEPTPPITIPDGHRVLAGKVEAGSRFTEPSATLLVTAIDQQEGVEAATELKNVHRGSLANAMKQTVKIIDPVDRKPRDLTRNFESNIVVLDIRGGKDLSLKRRETPLIAPGELLLMDADGNLMVRNELDDQVQYEKSIVREEPKEPKKPKEPKNNAKAKAAADPNKKAATKAARGNP